MLAARYSFASFIVMVFSFILSHDAVQSSFVPYIPFLSSVHFIRINFCQLCFVRFFFSLSLSVVIICAMHLRVKVSLAQDVTMKYETKIEVENRRAANEKNELNR